MPWRMVGSPPVSLKRRIPWSSIAARTTSRISSKLRMSSFGSQRTPSSGMQYTQRKLQRSVTLMRNTRTAAIDRGPVSNGVAGCGVGISRMGKRTAVILASRVRGMGPDSNFG
jgi:hypothetical protein